MLAAELLRRLGVQVTGIIFETPFFGSARGVAAAARLNIPHRVLNITEDHLAMVKAPRHGYGKNMNPCIDCHAMMFARAGQLLEEHGASFLFSGEVLGQRPMSQNPRALKLVEDMSGFGGLILRPLSAKLLPVTRPEEQGLVDRERLLGLEGRSRKPQMELAREWGLTEFPTPGGGCLLTDPGFSERLRELLGARPLAGAVEVEKLKFGRHFRLSGGAKVVVGRHHRDNEELAELAEAGDILLRQREAPGPLALLDADACAEDLATAASITARYTKAGAAGNRVVIQATGPGGMEEDLEVDPMGLVELERYRVG